MLLHLTEVPYVSRPCLQKLHPLGRNLLLFTCFYIRLLPLLAELDPLWPQPLTKILV